MNPFKPRPPQPRYIDLMTAHLQHQQTGRRKEDCRFCIKAPSRVTWFTEVPARGRRWRT